jgi:hypothetical protein
MFSYFLDSHFSRLFWPHIVTSRSLFARDTLPRKYRGNLAAEFENCETRYGA